VNLVVWIWICKKQSPAAAGLNERKKRKEKKRKEKRNGKKRKAQRKEDDET